MAALLGMGHQLLSYYLPQVSDIDPVRINGRLLRFDQHDLRKVADWCSRRFGIHDPRKAAADRVLASLAELCR